ncbi:hypothetical protein Ajs_3465 [Acidovorax sp. JS42]|nr:hypothetical protein Ajs_3465 [Acidovorax sp. JS42]
MVRLMVAAAPLGGRARGLFHHSLRGGHHARKHGQGSSCGTDGGSTCKETTTGRGGLAVLHFCLQECWQENGKNRGV